MQLNQMIAQLENRREKINHAIRALKELKLVGLTATTLTAKNSNGRRRTLASRQKQSETMKRHWRERKRTEKAKVKAH